MDAEYDELEKRKLQLEVEDLKTPSWKRPTFWLGIATAVAALGGVVGQHFLSQIRKEQAELAVAEATKRVQDLNRQEGELHTQIVHLVAWKANLTKANDTLAQAASASAPLDSSVKRVRTAENARYSVGIYAFDVASSVYDAVRKQLADDGYSISQDALLQERPNWLSAKSTVLYYADSNQAKAESIAKELEAVAGHPFGIGRGSGVGVIKGQEQWTFFVHVLRE